MLLTRYLTFVSKICQTHISLHRPVITLLSSLHGTEVQSRLAVSILHERRRTFCSGSKPGDVDATKRLLNSLDEFPKQLIDEENLSDLSLEAIANAVSNENVLSHSDVSLSALLETATSKIDNGSTQSMCRILHGCARLKEYQSEVLKNFISVCGERSKFATANRSEIRPDDVAETAFALGLLQIQDDDGTLSVKTVAWRLLQRLAFYGIPMLKKSILSPKLASRFIYGMGVLHFHDQALKVSARLYIQNRTFLKELSPSELSRLIFGLGEMRLEAEYYSFEVLTDIVLNTIGPGLFSSIDIASLLHSVVKLKWKNDKIDRVLAKEACRWARLKDYDPRTFASICLSLGRLNAAPNQIDIQRCLDYIKSANRIQLHTSTELSKIAFGLHRLGVRDADLWEAISLESVKPSRLRRFTQFALSSVVHVLPTHVDEESIWQKLSDEILRHRNLMTFSDSSIVAMITGLQHHPKLPKRLMLYLFAEINKRERLQRMSLHNLTKSLSALSRVQLEGRHRVRAFGQNLALEIMNSAQRYRLTAELFARTIYALGRAKKYRLAQPQIVIDFVAEALQSGIEAEFTTQGLSCVIFGLGELNFTKLELLHRFVELVLKKGIRNFITSELCSIYFGLGKCGYHRRDTICPLLEELAKEERIQDMDSDTLSTFLFGCAYHGLQDNDLVNRAMNRVLHLTGLHRLSSKQISIILFSLAVMHVENSEDQKKLIGAVLPYERDEPLADDVRKEISRLLYAIAMLRCKDEELNKYIAEELSRDEFELLSDLSPRGLSLVLAACTKLELDAPKLIEELRKRVLQKQVLDRIDSNSWANVLASVVTIDATHVATVEKIATKLFTTRSIKNLTITGMRRVMKCMFQTDVFRKSVYSKWFITQWLFYNDGLLISRLTNQQLTYLVSLLQSLAAQRYPHLGKLTAALKAEAWSLRRRDTIPMLDMQQMMQDIEEAERLIASFLPLHPIPTMY